MEQDDRILVAGSHTIVGMALMTQLTRQGYKNVVGQQVEDSNLTEAKRVDEMFSKTSPEFVFLAAGESGGISANIKNPASLMLNNLMVTSNIIDSAYRHGVKKLLYLASSCCYPRDCPQPMRVDHLMTGPLESTNEAYATAKLAGITLCEAFRQQYGSNFVAAIPANHFGAGDDFSVEDSHVVGALIHKIHHAKTNGLPSVDVWGSGNAQREFIVVDDLGDACIFIMNNYSGAAPINVGGSTALSIKELANEIKEVVGYQGEFTFDTTKPDGTPIKILDSSELLKLGWSPASSMRDALSATYTWFKENAIHQES